jgi:outer membrane murein-binding lipoprotein Lpp
VSNREIHDARVAVIAARAKRDAIAQKVAVIRDELKAAQEDERKASSELDKANRAFNRLVQDENVNAIRRSGS